MAASASLSPVTTRSAPQDRTLIPILSQLHSHPSSNPTVAPIPTPTLISTLSLRFDLTLSLTLTRNPHPRPRTRTTAPALTNGQVTAVHAGGLAARAGLLVDDRIVEVNSKDTGIETFASLLPKDETRPIRLKIVRMVEVAANEWPTSLLPDGVGSLRPPTQPAAPAAVGTRCVATFCCPGCGAALRHEFQAGALVGATTCTECLRPLKVRLPPRRPFLSLPAPSAAAGTASSAIAAAATTSTSGAADQVTAFVPGLNNLDNYVIKSPEVKAFGESESLELLETHAEEQEVGQGSDDGGSDDENESDEEYEEESEEEGDSDASDDSGSEEQAAAPPGAARPRAQTSKPKWLTQSVAKQIASLEVSKDVLEDSARLERPQESTQRSSGNKWTPEEEAKLKKAKLKVEEKGVRGKWQAITDELGTGRTPKAIQQHLYAMKKADEALDGGGNTGSEEEVEVVELQAVEMPAGETEVVDVEEVEPAQQEQETQERKAEQQIKRQQKTQQRTQQGAAAEQQEAQAAQVMDVTSLVPPPQPERKQTRACELVLIPLGDDAREEVGTE